MKILLIDPYRGGYSDVIEPLNLNSIASHLGGGHEIKIIALQFTDNWLKEIQDFQPNLVGVTSTTPDILTAYQIGDVCKKMKIRCIIGGPHASVMSEEALSHFDIVIRGEGEISFKNIIEKNIEEGIIEGEYIHNLDDLGHPSRSFFDMKKYITQRKKNTFNSAFGHLTKRDNLVTLMTSRGCSHNCNFCYNSWYSLPLRSHSIDWIMDEIQSLVTDFDATALFFTDDNFSLFDKRNKELCKRIIKEGYDLKWSVNARVDSVKKDTMELMKKAGCQRILFGFESGSQKVLDSLNKRTTVQQAKTAIRYCNELEIKIVGDFMVGNPNESEQDLKLTENFISKNKIDFVGVGFTTPFPGTKLWQSCKDKITSEMYPLMNTNNVVINLSEVDTERLIYWRQRIIRKSWLRFSNIPQLLKAFQNPKLLMNRMKQIW